MFFKLSIFVILLYFELVFSSDRCLTPNFEKGECVPLRSCDALSNSLQTQTKSKVDFVIKSRCGFVNKFEQKVCCGTLSELQDDVILSDKRFCGYQHSDDYSSSVGNGVSVDEFPWVAMLLYKNVTVGDDSQTISLCSGVLINRQYVLTAAQCLSIPKFLLIGIRLGEYDFKKEKDCIKRGVYLDCAETLNLGIVQSIMHEDYNERTGLNDIALLQLSKAVIEYTDFIRPLCLPVASIRTANIRDTLTSSGWGSVKHNGEPASVKKKIITNLISNEDCKEAYKNTRRLITNDHLCTRDSRDNVEFSCLGDAGVPIMFHNNKYQWHLEAISSGGGECGGIYPEVHTRVKNYIPWILKHLKSDLQRNY